MKPTKMTFQRLEKKYILTQNQYVSFMIELQPYIEEDIFGPSTICNIYYDTDSFALISDSLQKPPYKEKLRLRSYGTPQLNTIVYLEIKKKCAGVVNKRRIALTLEEVCWYLEEHKQPNMNSQILSEIDYFISFYKPTPKVFLAYDRQPFVGKENSELRFTFDQNIRRRYDHLSLSYGDFGECILQKGMVLMEIKVADAYPLWLTKLLSKHQLYPSSFSKYGTVFMEDIVKKERQSQCSQAF